MEALDEFHSGADEDSAQDERAKNSPKQDAVLQFVGNGKIIEDHQENKQIVDAERQLDHISGDELQAGLTPLPEVQNGGEGGSHRNIHQTPAQCFAKLHNMARPVKDPQVDYQHAHREDVEENPEVEQKAPRRRLKSEILDFRFQIIDLRLKGLNAW